MASTAERRSNARLGCYARLREASAGKDTTIGHWEIAGLLSPNPLPTFPEGFPQELLDAFTAKTGYQVLCNKPFSVPRSSMITGRSICIQGR